MDGFSDGYWWSADSVRLHFRDYAGAAGRPAILCLPGLTRNVRDFHDLALRLQGRGWRVVSVSLRGRGESGYAKDPLTYVPLTYVQDIGRLLATVPLDRVVVVGTSLGGLLAMLLGVTQRARLAGVVLNDVGPQLEAAGLERIRAQVGRGNGWPTWLHAARDIAERQAGVYPDWQLPDWLAHAKRLCRLSPKGRIVWDYDPRISAPFRLPGGDSGVDLALALRGLQGLPLLSLRGELSDVFAAAAQAAMVRDVAGLEAVTVPRVGHAPTLAEPEALAAIDRLLARV
ncbi:alpha/beta fold hydrolase [Sandaracinobacteroides saxicola]|uniref:Alpha/beta hydrolase n=1 Tax=Sandaracinobacteroides saxicola TaxID=2759707 RepID=A0A7G5IGW2_9SPHN|nr:alpha/beta hydrolase [Sandaracinobacteroides saxicola]QMW22604.1 alpha/beta hydrolase [Sandaracinobacteroides saxicola]